MAFDLKKHLRRRMGNELEGVWLYGSFALGCERPDRDIDLAILTRQPLPDRRLRELAMELAELCGREVDLVDLRRAPTVLQMQVISGGKRLFCRDRFVCEGFESRVFSDYVDLNERRAAIMEDIRRRGGIHG